MGVRKQDCADLCNRASPRPPSRGTPPRACAAPPAKKNTMCGWKPSTGFGGGGAGVGGAGVGAVRSARNAANNARAAGDGRRASSAGERARAEACGAPPWCLRDVHGGYGVALVRDDIS
eukprot:gene8498-biopygen2886